MKIARLFSATLITLCVATASALAAAAPVGTWTWSQPGRDAEITVSLKIEEKDGKLVGALTNPNATVDVTDLEVKDDAISFAVAGRRASTKYVGKIAGDKITGTIEMPARGGGEAKKVDWAAKRGAPAAKPAAKE